MTGYFRLKEGVEVWEDLAPASGMAPRLFDTYTLDTLIPGEWEAYARAFHPAGGLPPDRKPITWGEVGAWAGRAVHPLMQWETISRPVRAPDVRQPWQTDPDMGTCPAPVRNALAEVLRRHTRDALLCWVLIWEGYGDIADAFANVPRVRAGRNYILFRAPIDVVATGIFDNRYEFSEGPNAWWPLDRAWYVATEVDQRTTYVAGTRACIDAVLSETRLEAFEAHRGDDVTIGSDRINP